jgi:hypothetical protein
MPRRDTPHAMIGCGCEARFTREAVMTGRMEWCGVGSVLRVASRVAYAVIACMAAISVASGRGEAASFPPSEKLLPASTRVWVSVADPQALRKRFERSALGGLVYDPLMSTFLDGLRQQGRSSADPLRGTLEITLEEVEKIAGGEIALAVIERSDGTLATIVLIDTSGREAEVAPVVEAVQGRVTAKGGKSIAAPPPIKAFALPPAATTAGATAGATAAAPRQMAIAVAPSAVILGDRLDAVTEMAPALGNAAASRADALAAVPAFAKVMERCGKGVPATAAPVRWFVDPLAYLAADRRTFPPTKNKKGPDYVAILRRQGFDAVNGAGGYLFFGEGNVDLRHNTLIHAPPRNGRPADGPDRFEKAARMLRFPNVAGLAPAAWVPGGAASWVSFEWDIANAFDSMQPLVDDVVGEAGVFEDVIASLEEDPDGPQIKVRDDLIKHLGKRCAVASDHESPIDPDCERMLIAIETSNPEAVAKVISKGMTSESEVREVKAGGHLIWETVKPAATAERDAGASDGDDAAGRRRARQRERQEKETVWPNLSVAVAHGHIFLASHRDFLERVLNNPRTSSIIEDGGYQDVAAELKQLLGGDWAMSSFSRTEKAIRPAYELLRAGRLPESKSLAGTLLRRVLEGDQPQNGQRRGASQDPTQDPGRGKQKVDGSSLPEFEQISRYFGLNGMSMQSTPEGWYLVGVGLWDGGKQPAATPDAK